MELIDAFIILPFFIILCFGIILIRKDIAEIKELIDKKIMKKPSVEEKAKAYDEALEKLRSLYDDYDTVSTLIDIKEELEHIFPELAESEDERIRKEMITYLSTVEDKELIPYESWIAWLEKQGEQKPAEEYNITGISSNKSQGKLGEIIKNLKTTWSEKDEVGLANAMWAIEQARTIAKDENDMGNLWYAERWLKSLKERYTWKPSCEQMEFVWKYAEQNNYDGKVFTRLYNDLKKLKGE